MSPANVKTIVKIKKKSLLNCSGHYNEHFRWTINTCARKAIACASKAIAWPRKRYCVRR